MCNQQLSCKGNYTYSLFRNCSVFRTTQLGLCSKCRGVSTLSHYCTSCIGCQSSSGSHTSWQFWHTKFGAHLLRSIYTSESQNALAAELYVQPPFRLLDKPFMRTDFSKHAFRFSAPTVWNSLPQTVLISDSLTVFKSRLKTFLFNQAFTEHWSDLPPAPLKLQAYGAIEIRLLLLLLYLFLIWTY